MYELLTSALYSGVGAAVLRNIAGYVKTIFEDGEVTKYELKMLGATVVTSLFYASVYTLLGMPTEVSAGLAAITDVGISALKNAPNNSK